MRLCHFLEMMSFVFTGSSASTRVFTDSGKQTQFFSFSAKNDDLTFYMQNGHLSLSNKSIRFIRNPESI